MAKKKCVLCGSQYFYQSETILCDRCDRIFKMGEKMEAQHEAGESKIVAVGYRFFFENKTKETSRPSENELLYILERLGLALRTGERQGGCDESLYAENVSDPWTIRIATERVEALKQFLEWINRCVSNAYQEGHREGHSLLLSIANDDVTVKEINRRQVGKFKEESDD